MNYKFKKIFTNIRVIILLVFLVLAVISINPRPFAEGVTIGNVITNSPASVAGIQQPSPTTRPVSRERILEMNNIPITKVEDYYNFADNLEINQSIQIKTNKRLYRLTTREEFEIVELNETELIEVEDIVKVNKTINGTLTEINETIRKVIRVPKTEKVSKGVEDMGLRVFEVSKTNIRKGLDIQGGTRVLLQPEQILNPFDLAI